MLRRPVTPRSSFGWMDQGPREDPGAAGQFRGTMARSQPVESHPSILYGVRVLLVDDHPVVREVVARLLEEYGARVTAVPGVPETFEALGREVPDVLLSNIEMPGEDGYALIRKVRALPPDRGGLTPAVALTGWSTVADRARALQAGFHAHVAKPVDVRELVTIVTTLAARHQAALAG